MLLKPITPFAKATADEFTSIHPLTFNISVSSFVAMLAPVTGAPNAPSAVVDAFKLVEINSVLMAELTGILAIMVLVKVVNSSRRGK